MNNNKLYSPKKTKNGVLFCYIGDETTKSVSIAGIFNNWTKVLIISKKIKMVFGK